MNPCSREAVRGVWIVDDISPLQQMTEKALAADSHLFDVRPGTSWLNDASLNRYAGGAKYFRGDNPQPGTSISYHLKSAPSGEVKIKIADITGKVVRNLSGTKEAGLNRVLWNLRGDPPPRPPGMRGGPPPASGQPPAQEVQSAQTPQAGQPQPSQQAGQQGGQGQPQMVMMGGGSGGGGGRFGGAFFGPALDPGVYLVKLSVDGKEMTTKVMIEADNWKQ